MNNKSDPKTAETIAIDIFDKFGIAKDKKITKQQFIDGYHIFV